MAKLPLIKDSAAALLCAKVLNYHVTMAKHLTYPDSAEEFCDQIEFRVGFSRHIWRRPFRVSLFEDFGIFMRYTVKIHFQISPPSPPNFFQL